MGKKTQTEAPKDQFEFGTMTCRRLKTADVINLSNGTRVVGSEGDILATDSELGVTWLIPASVWATYWKE